MNDVANKTMRDLKLRGKVYKTTKQLLAGLAWATNRRGRNPWEAKGILTVPSMVVGYLEDHDVVLPESIGFNSMKSLMDRLVGEGWADSKRDEKGHIVFFKFKEDVNLNGFEPKFRDKGGTAPVTPAATEASDGHLLPGSPVLPELPYVPMPRYMEAEVNDLLSRWADKDPDTYAEWVDQLLPRLRALAGS
jgi:hypothetical protein